MKKASFAALLYREGLLVKKSLLINAISSICMLTIVVLVLLSFRYGNLALIFKDSGMVTEDAQAFITAMSEAMKYMSVFSVSISGLLAADATARDVKKPVWEHFRRSTPVSCYRIALAKTVIMTIGIAASVALAMITINIVCYAIGDPVTESDIALAFVIVGFASLLGAFQSVAVAHFKSPDKAGIAMIGFMLVCAIPISPVFSGDTSLPSDTPEQRMGIMMTTINEAAVSLLPFVLFIFVAIIVLHFIILSLVLKRREK